MQDKKVESFVNELVERYPRLIVVKKEIEDGYEVLKNSYQSGGKLLIAGNGGSCADSEHIVGELMKGFCLARKVPDAFSDALKEIDQEMGADLAAKLQGALPAIALDNHNALNTAYSNDVDGLLCYAQQVYGYGTAGDVFFGISTSGNSNNILNAAIVAKAKGMKVIGLTGEGGGKLANESYRFDGRKRWKPCKRSGRNHQGSRNRNVYDTGITSARLSLLVFDVGERVFLKIIFKYTKERDF